MKVNKHGLKMEGLKKVCGAIKRYEQDEDVKEIDIMYDVKTGQTRARPYYEWEWKWGALPELEQNEISISVNEYVRMQEIADAIYTIVSAEFTPGGGRISFYFLYVNKDSHGQRVPVLEEY